LPTSVRNSAASWASKQSPDDGFEDDADGSEAMVANCFAAEHFGSAEAAVSKPLKWRRPYRRKGARYGSHRLPSLLKDNGHGFHRGDRYSRHRRPKLQSKQTGIEGVLIHCHELQQIGFRVLRIHQDIRCLGHKYAWNM
jgi:hypothetical protein